MILGPHGDEWAKRFWPKVARKTEEECWLWLGQTDHKGYGVIGVPPHHRHRRQAHRISWLINRGPIPDGLCVLHRCDNPPCVNPEHLFLGTNLDNNADRTKKGRSNRWRKHRHPRAKLTKEQVIEIRQSRAPRKEIALKFNVTVAAIKDVRSGRSWSWI